MLSLNLLPPERKEAFYWRGLTKGIIFWGGRILTLLVFFSLNFLMINLYLINQISGLDQEISYNEGTDSIKQLRLLEKSSKEVNNTLTNIDKVGENQIYWDDALNEVARIVPPDVQIFSLEIALDGKFSIAGKARTRDQVLSLEDNLKKSAYFKDIQSPLDNLIDRNDVDFKFMGVFLTDKFKASEKVKA